MSQASTETYTYRVIRGSIRLPRTGDRKFVTRSNFITQGELLPDGIFPESDIASWLAEGRIAPATVTAEVLAAARERNLRKGKWVVDPASLAGKTLEDLLVMVLDIDEDFNVDLLKTEEDAVRQLTSEWDPVFAEQVSTSFDQSSVPAMGPDGVKDAGSKPMSQSASDKLEAARARAQSSRAEKKE